MTTTFSVSLWPAPCNLHPVTWTLWPPCWETAGLHLLLVLLLLLLSWKILEVSTKPVFFCCGWVSPSLPGNWWEMFAIPSSPPAETMWTVVMFHTGFSTSVFSHTRLSPDLTWPKPSDPPTPDDSWPVLTLAHCLHSYLQGGNSRAWRGNKKTPR